jgi:hypothetical protein
MDIWQVLGTPQIAEITAVVSIIVSVSLAQKPSPSKKKKMDIDSCCHRLICSVNPRTLREKSVQVSGMARG